MISTKVSQEIIGSEIAKPIYSQHGTMLIKKGTVVNNDVISRLLSHNVDVVYLLNALSSNPSQPIIPKKQMEKSVEAIKKVFDDVLNNEKLGVRMVIPKESVALVQEILDLILDTLENAEDILYSVEKLINSDDYTYRHNVNVAVLTILTAKALMYKNSDIQKIALGAMLHDIGKMRVREELIKKEGSLTDQERIEMEAHAELGYELVESVKSIPFLTKQIIRFHHEKLDGTGYPLGLKGIEIPEYVRIVTMCDMYDAITSDRVYRKKMPIYRALEILMTESVYKLDRNVYTALSSTIAIYPKGSGVILSDGRVGIVASYSHSNPTRPLVKIIKPFSSESEFDLETVDLTVERTIFINGTWDVEEINKIIREAMT